ncbi:MAG TPA: HAD family hydrolase [bacterium]|nr:HAD family hydrolase [bacterium]
MRKARRKRPAVFLDRDGTLIRDAEYLSDPSQIRLFSKTAAALKLLKKAGFLLLVVSNQSGVARGYFPERMVGKVHRKLKAMLQAKGVRLDAFFYCPHHPKGTVKRYSRSCSCRKPGTGMVRQALRRYPIDLKRSFVVGDKMDDMLLGRNAKVAGSILVGTGHGKEHQKRLMMEPLGKTWVASDILTAAHSILAKGK